MSVIPLGEVRDRLSEVVSEVETTHERVTITKHGRPSVVLIAADDLESLEETLDILGKPAALEQIRKAEAEFEAGDYVSADDLLEQYRATGS